MSDMEGPTRIPSRTSNTGKEIVTNSVHDASDVEQLQRPALEKFSYSFWAPEIAHLRALYFKILVASVGLLIVVIWGILPIYWGSLWKAAELTSGLRAWVIDRDGGAVGQAITSAIASSVQSGSTHVLGWEQIDPSIFPTNEAVGEAVIDERSWIAVVINSGATENLNLARASGDASYNPASAIDIYYTQGRNEIGVGSYIIPITTALLSQALGQFNARSVAQYLGTIGGNETAFQLLVQAPQTVSQPIYWTTHNLRPYTAQVATAVTLVGQIYVIIIAFFVTMSGGGAREIIAPYLSTKSLIKLRIIVPLIVYLLLSLIYAMISLPFKLPFDAKYTYGGGFFVFVALIYVGMLALGLVTEAAFTLLGPKFMGYFLMPLIVINVSGTVVPHEIQPSFYKISLGLPVPNMSQAVRTIIFDTKNHLGRNFGVLLAWAVLAVVVLPLLQILVRRFEQKEEVKRVNEEKLN